MADSALRRRQRRGEATGRDLARAGLVSQERLELADRVRASGWSDRKRLLREAAELLGPTLPARLAADYAARLPQTEAGAAAIAAARAWAAEPTEARRRAAAAAGAAAYGRVYTAVTPANAAARAARAAAWAARWASREARAWAAHAAAVASIAADGEKHWRLAADGEKHWQRERLALYLGSPIWPNPVEVIRG